MKAYHSASPPDPDPVRSRAIQAHIAEEISRIERTGQAG